MYFKEGLESPSVLRDSGYDVEFIKTYLLMVVDLLEIIKKDQYYDDSSHLDDTKATYDKLVQYIDEQTGGLTVTPTSIV